MPKTTIHVFSTGGPTMLLFDGGSRTTRFIHGADFQHNIEKLRGYAEIWQRLTPHQGEAVGGQYAPGLRVRYLDADGKPQSHETPLSTPYAHYVFPVDGDCFFGLSCRRGDGTHYSVFGTDQGESFWLNLVYGRKSKISDLRLDGNAIKYRHSDGSEGSSYPDAVFDYSTGERVA